MVSGLVWSGRVWSGLVSLVWSGLVWSGLVWSGIGLNDYGLVISGLVNSGLAQSSGLYGLVLSYSGLIGLLWFDRPALVWSALVRLALICSVWSGLFDLVDSGQVGSGQCGLDWSGLLWVWSD